MHEKRCFYDFCVRLRCAFHLVKCRAIVKLTILSNYIKQRPTVKFERLSLPQIASSRLITSGSFAKSWKKVA